MTDEELLQAIAGIIDKKLDEKLHPINEKIDEINEKLTEVDDSIGIITEWIEKVADKERIPFLEVQQG